MPMKAPLMLLLFMGMPVYATPGDSAYTCRMGDYVYQGVYHSDSYNMPGTKGQASCKEREAMDSEKIGKEYKANHQMIRDQIKKMMDDPQCVYLKPVMENYLDKYQKNEDQFTRLTNIRTDYVAEKIKKYDVQKAYAYAGAFNGTCSGGHNRKTSFINLEFINELPQAKGGQTQVKKEGEEIDSCADVSADGTDDLKSFFVSTKNAKGKDFLFTWDPFGVPDHVTVKSKSGALLYDSGCKGADTTPEPIKLPVQKDGIVISVINTCETPAEKSSAWSLRIQCGEPSDVCKEPKEELTALVKKEIELTKTLIDASKLQQQCYYHIDKDILGDLLQDGMIEEENAPMTNGICDVSDDGCQDKINQSSQSDIAKAGLVKTNTGSGSGIGNLLPYREPSQEQFNCPERKDVQDSIFKTVSYAYCKHGWKRLGLENTEPE